MLWACAGWAIRQLEAGVNKADLFISVTSSGD